MRMKKTTGFLLALAVTGSLLSGCGGSGELSIFTGRETVTGEFDGKLTDGAPDGSGTFTATEGWTYTGSFESGNFARGEAENLPWAAEVNGAIFAGCYTGGVEALSPQGEGTLTGEEGAIFTGSFSDGHPDTGAAEKMPYAASINGETLSGVYTGRLQGGLATGEGDFYYAANGRCLHYSGGWAEGAPAGEGTLSDDGYRVYSASGSSRGTFEGGTIDGVPNQSGTFRGRNAEDVDYLYSGQWKDGAFHGYGELIYDSELYYDRCGTFTNGRFTPDGEELLAAYGSAEPLFTLSQEQLDYLADYPELYDSSQDIPDYRVGDYRLLYTGEVNYDSFKAAPEKYPDGWILFYNYLILDKWEDSSFGEEYKVTRITASNTVYTNPIECFLFGEVPNLDKATRFTMYGYPLALSSYTNADGEAVEAIVVLVGSMGVY